MSADDTFNSGLKSPQRADKSALSEPAEEGEIPSDIREQPEPLLPSMSSSTLKHERGAPRGRKSFPREKDVTGRGYSIFLHSCWNHSDSPEDLTEEDANEG